MIKFAIPFDVNEKYEVLSNEVSHLHRKWGICRQLYVSGDEIIALMVESAFGFFSVCKEVLANDIVLTISRLTDPKQSFGNDNLTLEQLVHSIDAGNHPKLRNEIEQLYVESKNKCRVTKDLRNKLIAHSDLASSFRQESRRYLTLPKILSKRHLSQFVMC